MSGMDIKEVLQYLPHRYPFLLIDRVLDCEPGKRIIALKNVTINEHFFVGHFPHHPIMPGVMIIEALAQAAAILSFQTMEHKADRAHDIQIALQRRGGVGQHVRAPLGFADVHAAGRV